MLYGVEHYIECVAEFDGVSFVCMCAHEIKPNKNKMEMCMEK